MRAEHDIHIGIAFFDRFGHPGLLGHAAADADHHVGVGFFIMGGLSHVAEDPHLGVLPDGAGVEDQKIGPLLVVGHAEAHVGQHAADELAVGLVLLTAEGDDAGQRLAGQARPIKLPHPVGIVLLERKLLLWDHSVPIVHIASRNL